MPKVSVLLPLYNAEKSLERAALSVLNQSFGDLELICFNDGSTDTSSAILKRLADADSRIVILEHPANRGVGRARNACLERAQGDYLIFVDADDFIEPEAIAHTVKTAEEHSADIVSFRLDVKSGPTVSFGSRPENLSDRFCHGLWDKPFQHQDVPESIFQLGVGLNNAMFRLAFIREAKLSFENQRVGEWIPFVNMALALAGRIVLLNETLYRVNWWHGSNLTQTTFGNSRRYYQQLLASREKLQVLGVYQTLERSHVNHVAETVIAELEAQRGSIAYTAAAKFYRVYGFDALGIIGFPQQYYFDPAVHTRLRQIILGDVYSDQEQLVIDLKADNGQLAAENRKLKKRLESWRGHVRHKLDQGEQQENRGWRLASRAVHVFQTLFSAKSANTAESSDSSSAKPSDKPADASGAFGKQKMNASTGYRLTRLCDYLLELDPPILAEHKQELAASIRSHKDGIKACIIYGEEAISLSNKVYASFLDRLLLLMHNTSLDDKALVSEIASLRSRVATSTEPKMKFIFNLEQEQVFPSLESVFSASREDMRIESALVYAPLGQGIDNWKRGDAPLFDKSGQLKIKQKNDYGMFRESPDILVTARPYLNCNQKPYCLSKHDRFEILPAAASGYRVVYLPYAFFDTISETSIKYGYQYTLHPVAWKITAYSKQILGNFRKYSELEGNNAILLGAPRYDVSSGVDGFRHDELTEEYEKKINDRPTLFWNPHFRTVRSSGQQLLDYHETVLQYFMDHPSLVLFWRPHPMMFASLVELDILTQREVDDMLDQISSFENIIFDQSKDYINAFALSNAMLTDGDSSLPYEYIATGKPVYIHYIYGESEGALRKKYQNHIPLLYCRDCSRDELIERLDSFARGEDPLKEDRLEKATRFIHDNDGHAGERVKNHIVEELFKDEDALARNIIYPAGDKLKMRATLRIREEDGMEELEPLATAASAASMATPLFYEAFPGDRLVLADDAYTYAVARYAPGIEPAKLLAGDPPLDQSWTTYQGDAGGFVFGQEPYTFSDHVYFRVCAQRNNCATITWEDVAADVVRFDALPRSERLPSEQSHSEPLRLEQPQPDELEKRPAKDWLIKEASRVSHKVKDMRKPGELVFALLGDAHYAVNGTWDDTVSSLQSVHGSATFNSILYLGDLTDGQVTLDALREYVKTMQEDLKRIGVPLRAVLGEHDSNALRGNPEPLSLHEQSRLYLDSHQPHYYVDAYKGHLRLIFLDSYDHSNAQPFGYSDDCIMWLRHTLAETPRARQVIIFSHMPPVARLQRSTETLRGEDALMNVLRGHSRQIMAFIHSHNHADNLDNEEAFPILSIASSTCAGFQRDRPEGFIAPERALGCAQQECWDVMMVNPVENRIRFIRFGAGNDRIVEDGVARWV